MREFQVREVHACNRPVESNFSSIAADTPELQDQKTFEVRWHPFFLNPDAPKEGINKMEMYKQKFGAQRVEQMVPMMTVSHSNPLSCMLAPTAAITHSSHVRLHLAAKPLRM